MVHNMGIKWVFRVSAVWANRLASCESETDSEINFPLPFFFFFSEMNYIIFGISITFDVQRRLVYQAI